MFFVASALDLVGVGLVGGYITLLTKPQVIDQLPTWLLSLFGSLTSDYLFETIGALLILTFALKAVAAVSVHRTILKFSLGQMTRLRVRAIKAIQGMPYSKFVQRNSSEYVQAVISYTGQFNGSLTGLLRLMCDSIVALAILVFLSVIEPLAVLALLSIGLVLVLAFDKIVRSRLHYFGLMSNLGDQLTIRGVQEAARGFKEIRILGREHLFFEQVAQGSKQLAVAQQFIQLIGVIPRFLVEFVIVFLVVAFSVFSLHQGRSIESIYPVVGMFAVAAIRIGPIASQGIQGISILRKSRPAIVALRKEFDSFSKEPAGQVTEEVSSNEIFEYFSLNRAGFSYSSASEKVVTDVSLTVKRGERVGLIGVSGSGKSTLVDIILGLLPLDEGELEFNGRSVQSSPRQWRAMVAYLPQENFLLDQTLKRNITLTAKDDEVEPSKLRDAVDRAKLRSVAEKLPLGLDTEIGELGTRLSGGQRQRVILARAFYHGREVLIMDESTSALDAATEAEIIRELEGLSREVTIFIISHRPETLKFCDVVYEITDRGVVISQSKDHPNGSIS